MVTLNPSLYFGGTLRTDPTRHVLAIDNADVALDVTVGSGDIRGILYELPVKAAVEA